MYIYTKIHIKHFNNYTPSGQIACQKHPIQMLSVCMCVGVCFCLLNYNMVSLHLAGTTLTVNIMTHLFLMKNQIIPFNFNK